MSINYGYQPIVTNGLVLHLDAANPNSYRSGSTAWNDLSGNRNNGTFISGSGYSSTNFGSIVFDGTSQNVSLPTSTANVSNASTYAFIVSFSSVQTNVRSLISYGNASSNFLCNIRLSSASDSAPSVGNARLAIRSADLGISINNTIIGTTNIAPNTIYNLAFVMLPSSYKIYINGIEETVSVFGGLNDGKWIGNGITSIPTGVALASYFYTNAYTPSTYFAGNMYLAQVYNRALSATEVQQNYLALKSRYGL